MAPAAGAPQGEHEDPRPSRDAERAQTGRGSEQPSRGRYALAARELLRDTLLDAARDELTRRDWHEITMADIAAAAGVSRQTLYKEFGSREAFAQAFVVREGDRFLAAVEEAVFARLHDPARALSAAFGVFLTAAAEDPLVRRVVYGDGELLSLLTTQGRPLIEHATERLAGIILAGWPQVEHAQAELLAECLVRLAISHAVLPTTDTTMTAASVTALLDPYIERVLSEAGALAHWPAGVHTR